MSQPRDDRQDDLFRPPLKEIINLRHSLVRLAGEIDWDFLARRFGSVRRVGPGQPPLPTRLVAGLFSSTCTTSPMRRCATDGWRTRISSTSAGKLCSGTTCRLIVSGLLATHLAPRADLRPSDLNRAGWTHVGH